METRTRTQMKEIKKASETLLALGNGNGNGNENGSNGGSGVNGGRLNDEEYETYRRDHFKQVQDEKTTLRSKSYSLFYYHRLIQEGMKDKKLRRQLDDEWKAIDFITRDQVVKSAEDFFDRIIN